MAIETLYDFDKLPQGDLYGILIPEDKIPGLINRKPLRRIPVPFLAMDLFADNDRRLRVLVRDQDMNVVDLTGATGIFTVKETKNDTSPVFSKSTAVPAEGMIGAADEGEMFFFIVPDDTKDLDIRQYRWDVRVTVSGGETYTVVTGVLNLLQPVGTT